MTNAQMPQPRQNELFDIDLSSLLSMLFFSSIISLVLMIFSVTVGVVILAGSFFFIVSFAVVGGFNRSITAKEYGTKLWRSICITVLFILTLFVVGVILGIPFEVVWGYLIATFIQKVPVGGIAVSKILTLLNYTLPPIIPYIQVRIALLFYISLFGLGLILAAGWETGKWGKVLIIKLYSGLFIISLFGAILNAISPIAFEKVLGWGPQLNGLIGNPLPEELSYWWLIGLAVLAAIIFSIAKSKKPGEEITGWIVLLIGVALIVFVVGAIAGIFSGGKVKFFARDSKSGKTVSALPKSRPVKVIKILDPETQIHIVRAPADSLTNSNICSRNGYLRIEVGNLTQNIQTPVGYVSARGYNQYYPPEKLLLPSAPAFALLAAYGKDKSSLFPVVTEGQDFFETNSAKKGEPIYLVRNIKMQHNTLGNQISLVTIHTD